MIKEQYRVEVKERMDDGHDRVFRVVEATNPFEALKAFLALDDGNLVSVREDVETISVELV